jgi:hypothetical protein
VGKTFLVKIFPETRVIFFVAPLLHTMPVADLRNLLMQGLIKDVEPTLYTYSLSCAKFLKKNQLDLQNKIFVEIFNRSVPQKQSDEAEIYSGRGYSIKVRNMEIVSVIW